MVYKVEHLIVHRLNKRLIPETGPLRDAEAKIQARTQARKKCSNRQGLKVNAREATAAANASDVVGASESSTAPTETVASSGPRSAGIMDLS